MSATITLNYVAAHHGTALDSASALRGMLRLGAVSDDDALRAALEVAQLAASLGADEVNVTLWNLDRNIGNVHQRQGGKAAICYGPGYKPTPKISK